MIPKLMLRRISPISVFAALVALTLLPSGMPRAAEIAPSYRVGPEDTIRVTVARHPEFSGEFFIPADGKLDLPGAGKTLVDGLTLSEVGDLVKLRLSGRLRQPEVTVTLGKPRMQRVYVLGVVKNAGAYDARPDWRITEAVAAAGGLAEDVETTDCSATLLSASTGKSRTVQLDDAMRGVAEANMPLQSGDVLTVDTRETVPVYVMGRVRTPGAYRLRGDAAQVTKALALAGGTLEDAAVSRITITHLSGKSETLDLAPAILQGKQDPGVVLQAGDLVVVPEETARVAILGYVNQPGFYPLRDGQKLTLSEALGLAKGVDNKGGSLGGVAVVRTEAGVQQKMLFDVSKFLKSGDASQNPEIRSGDVIYVAQSSRPDWQTIISGIASVGWLLAPW